MSKADWKRYYFVVWDRPFALPSGFKNAEDAREHYAVERQHWEDMPSWRRLLHAKPIGVVGVRGKTALCQQWLWSRTQ
jgi:hypothetical protein